MTANVDGLQHVQRATIRAVSDGDWHASSEIAAEIDRETATINHTFLSLINRDVLERRANPLNPKGYLYRLTDEARDTLEFCDLCGEMHDSTAGVLYCCSEQFGDEPAPGSISVRGPAPGVVVAHEERDSR